MTILGKLMHLHHLDPISQYNFAISKIQGGAHRRLKKNKKIAIYPQQMTNFDKICNINDKNSSLSIMLTAIEQQLQKS